MRDKFHPDSAAGKGLYSGINSADNLASMIFAPGKEKIWVGLPMKKGLSPYPADGKFIEIDADHVLKKGEPLPKYDILSPIEWKGHNLDWLKVRDAEFLVEKRENKKALKLLNEILADNSETSYPHYYVLLYF